MTTELIETEEVHQAVPVSSFNAPIKFSVTDQAIAEMKERFMPLTIAGPDDKAGWQAVYDARMVVKGSRVDVEKKRKQLNEDALAHQRKVNGEAKRITGLLEEVEDHLEKEEKAYNDERKRIAEEKAEIERQRYQSRVLQLKDDYGFVFDDFFESYVLGTVIINKDDIRDLSDENYAPTLVLAKQAFEAEQQRIADKKNKEELAEQRIANLRKLGFIWDSVADGYTFTDGLGAEQYTVFSDDCHLSEEDYSSIRLTAKRIYDAEQARLTEIQQKADELKEANRVEAERLQAIADEQAAAQKLIDDQRKQLEDDRRKMILNGRTPMLEAAGFEYTGNRFKLGTTIKLGQEDIVDMADQQFADLLVDAKAKVKEAADKEAQRIKDEKQALKTKNAADKERKNRLAPDKKELRAWAIRLGNFPAVQTKQEEASELAISFLTRLSALAQEFVVEIDAL